MIIHNQELLKSFYEHDKINVAIVSDIYFPTFGGATFVVDNLAKSLNATGMVNAVVVTGEVKGYQDKVDYPVIRCKSLAIPKSLGDSLPIPNYDKNFKKLIDELNIDVVDVHTVFGVCTYFMNYAKKNNLPIAFHGHSKFNQEYPTIVKFAPVCKYMINRAYKIVKKADMVLPVSNNTMQEYLKFGVKNQMRVLSNATDLVECAEPDLAFSYVEKMHGITKDFENVLVFVSRIEAECKNIWFMLDSLKILSEKGLNFKTIIIGDGKDLEKVKKTVQKIGLSDKIVFTGEIRDRQVLSYYLYRADLNIFPSVKDTFSLTKTESASQKTPTLAIENTGAGEGIVDGENGFLSKEIKEDFADKILFALSDKNMLKIVSVNAQKTLGKNWDYIANESVEIYQKLIEEKVKTK